MIKTYLAADLGAGSGRVIAAHFHPQDGRLTLEEVHRFENPGTDLPGGSFWNPIQLYRDIVEGIRLAIAEHGNAVCSFAVDTWGVDFGLLDANNELLGVPHQYRDPRTQGMEEELAKLISPEDVYRFTGVHNAFYNTSLQLLAAKRANSPALDTAERLLFVPDLLTYWLCGVAANEVTIASTSQLFDAKARNWSSPMIEALGLPRGIFGDPVEPGTPLGPLRDAVARLTGADKLNHPIQVIASASHDTASAVAAVPAEGDDHVWISCGTWSILGIESDSPHLDDKARDCGLSNELGVNGTTRLLRNVSGLWMIQECQRQWELDGTKMNYGEMADLATSAKPFTAFVNPDVPEFARPDGMPDRIREFCAKTNQPEPTDKATILRVATESIALAYALVIGRIQTATGKTFRRIHIVGGGTRNELLMQATADATGLDVIAGPVEATACGNVMMQLIATGAVNNIDAARDIIRKSFPLTTYQPSNQAEWQEPLQRFKQIVG